MKTLFFIITLMILIILIGGYIQQEPGRAYEMHGNGYLRDSPFGMGAYLYRASDIGQMRRRAKCTRELGATWIREEFLWAPEPGAPDLREFQDTFVNVALENGLYIYGLLSGYEEMGAPDTPVKRRQYALLLKELIQRYKGRIQYWQVWNEPDNKDVWPGMTAQNYAGLLKEAYIEAKQADRAVKILGPTIDSGDIEYLEDVFKAGGLDYIDIITVHPYSYPLPIEESWQLQAFSEIRRLMREYGEEKPIWVSEVGVSTYADGVNEGRQAEMLVRIYLTLIASGAEVVTWYDLVDDGSDFGNREDNFGLLHRDFSEKKAYGAYKTMTRILTGFQFIKELQGPQETKLLLFENRDNEQVIAAWTYNEEIDERGNVISFTPRIIPINGRVDKVLDIYGRDISFIGSQLEISHSPLYIIGRDLR